MTCLEHGAAPQTSTSGPLREQPLVHCQGGEVCHWAVLEHRSLFVREHSPCFLCSYRSTPQSQTRHWFGSTVLLRGERPVQEECFPSGQLPRQGRLLMRAGPCRTHLHHPGATLVWPGRLDSGRARHLARLGVSRAPARVLVLQGIGLKGQWNPLTCLFSRCPAVFIFRQPQNQAGLAQERERPSVLVGAPSWGRIVRWASFLLQNGHGMGVEMWRPCPWDSYFPGPGVDESVHPVPSQKPRGCPLSALPGFWTLQKVLLVGDILGGLPLGSGPASGTWRAISSCPGGSPMALMHFSPYISQLDASLHHPSCVIFFLPMSLALLRLGGCWGELGIRPHMLLRVGNPTSSNSEVTRQEVVRVS